MGFSDEGSNIEAAACVLLKCSNFFFFTNVLFLYIHIFCMNWHCCYGDLCIYTRTLLLMVTGWFVLSDANFEIFAAFYIREVFVFQEKEVQIWKALVLIVYFY